MSDNVRTLLPYLMAILQTNVQQQSYFASLQEEDTNFMIILMSREEEIRHCLLTYYQDSQAAGIRSYWRLYNQ